jgi:hypothetical protein
MWRPPSAGRPSRLSCFDGDTAYSKYGGQNGMIESHLQISCRMGRLGSNRVNDITRRNKIISQTNCLNK